MQVEDIALSKHTSIRLRMRALYNKLTRKARGGQELEWQARLTELDPELHLRWNYVHRHWSVYYDHHDLLTTICTFKPGESFGKVYKNLKYNSFLTPRHLLQMKKEQDGQAEKKQDDLINEAAKEFGTELHHGIRGRVTNIGGVDPLATPKPKPGKIRL